MKWSREKPQVVGFFLGLRKDFHGEYIPEMFWIQPGAEWAYCDRGIFTLNEWHAFMGPFLISCELPAECEHENRQDVASYYNDTEWCPDCGAVRGNNGLMGPKFKWLEWQVPK